MNEGRQKKRRHDEVNSLDSSGKSLIYRVIDREDNKQILELMNDSQVDINLLNSAGMTPIIYAMLQSYNFAVECLLDHPDINLLHVYYPPGTEDVRRRIDEHVKISETQKSHQRYQGDVLDNFPFDVVGILPYRPIFDHLSSKMIRKFNEQKKIEEQRELDLAQKTKVGEDGEELVSEEEDNTLEEFFLPEGMNEIMEDNIEQDYNY
jgi:ankyrin repeat protein